LIYLISSKKNYACRAAFAKKRPRVNGRFVCDSFKKPRLAKYARRGRPSKYPTLEQPTLESINSSQTLPISRENNHQEYGFRNSQELLNLFTENIKSTPKPLLPNTPFLSASSCLDFSAHESLNGHYFHPNDQAHDKDGFRNSLALFNCFIENINNNSNPKPLFPTDAFPETLSHLDFGPELPQLDFLQDPHLNEQMYDEDGFSHSHMIPSAALSAASSLLDLGDCESPNFDFLRDTPPNDQKHNKNACNLERELSFDSVINMPYDFQEDPTSWGENFGSEVLVSDSTFATKYAGAIGRFGVFPARPGCSKDKIIAEVRNPFQELTFER